MKVLTKFLLIIVVAALVSCTKSTGGDPGPTPYLPLKIESVTITEPNLSSERTNFTYDEQGRLINFGSGSEMMTVNYAADKIRFTDSQGDELEFRIVAGRAVSMTGYVMERSERIDQSATISYNSQNYMTGIRYTQPENEEYTYDWSFSNIVKKTDPQGIEHDFIYGNQRNNLNLDIFSLILNDDLTGMASLIDFTGKRNYSLPSSFKSNGMTVPITYSVNASGYIVKINIGTTMAFDITYK